MKKIHWSDVRPDDVTEPGAENIQIRWAIGEDDGAPNVALRVFDVFEGGHTPFHDHPWEHAVYVLDGEGTVARPDGSTEPVRAGDVVYVPPNEKHSFSNSGAATLRFICVIPSRGQCLATVPGSAPLQATPDGTR
jgi:quercetin dioxygenase-like cupin family protein